MKYLIFLLINFSFILSTKAQPGTLDNTFGDSGKLIYYSNGFSTAVTVLSTGKIITAGDGVHEKDSGYKLVCYNEDGSFNEAFGKQGFAILNYAGLTNAECFALSILPNDFIMSAGFYLSEEHNNADVLLVKLNSKGSIDSTFGINGIVITDFGEAEFINAMKIQPDGKIVVAGESEHYPNKTMLVVRYLESGVLDESFGDKGKVLINAGQTANSVALQKDGKIVVGGVHFDGDNSFLLVRLNPDGSYDESFGNRGKVITDFSNHDEYINSVVIQPDGKILAAGVSGVFVFDSKDIMSVARYDEQGNLDSSFGNGGKATVKFPSLSEAITILLQSDGKIVLSGETKKENYINNIALCRLCKNGSIDSAFGINGLNETDFGGYENATSAVLQKDGKILVTGNNYLNGSNDILARYNNDLTRKQILFAKLRRWLQHHNGIIWDNAPGTKSYAVQRSSNGVNWSTLHNQPFNIQHSTLSINNYYEDPSPLPGTNYYRLQTTSNDGNVAYSNIIAITNAEIKILPNPAKNVLHIEGLSSTQNLPAGRHGTKIMVVDISGNIKLQVVANATAYNLNIASLKAGNYLLKIEMNGEVVTKQFVKE